ncbi:hypothetical protein L2E82_20539 [Cichorium intybus]|uniref:Uncharacterized protein n=1 Tax=Cichorium intybus TaxID=13427 RepID=A0ACB9DTB8_CICIN|nr:hypothetical protein L2E82_20539 [Cichorium intybus]
MDSIWPGLAGFQMDPFPSGSEALRSKPFLTPDAFILRMHLKMKKDLLKAQYNRSYIHFLLLEHCTSSRKICLGLKLIKEEVFCLIEPNN